MRNTGTTLVSHVYFNMSLAAFFIQLTADTNIGFGCQLEFTFRLASRLAMRVRDGERGDDPIMLACVVVITQEI